MCPWDIQLREMRAQCYIKLGDFFKAVGDVRPTTKLIPDNTDAYLLLSSLYYRMGEADTSLTLVTKMHHALQKLPIPSPNSKL